MRPHHPSDTSPLAPVKQGRGFNHIEATSGYLPPAQHFARLHSDFSKLLIKSLDRSDAAHIEKQAVRRICGLTRHQRPHGNPMSHLRMRRRAGFLLYRALRPIWLAHPDRVWGFGTFIPNVGNSLEYAPHVELFRVKRDVGKMLAAVEMHAIGVTELQLGQFPGAGAGRTLQDHLHTLGYFDDPATTLEGAEATLTKRFSPLNWLGARIADFQPIESLSDLEFRCHYMFKSPLETSYLCNDTLMRSGKSTQKSECLTPSGALLLMQILSQITLGNAAMAHGDLVKLKGDWIREVSAWTNAHPVRKDFDYPRAFSPVWAGTRTRKNRADPIIRFDAKAPLDPQWDTAMQSLFGEIATSEARRAVAKPTEISRKRSK